MNPVQSPLQGPDALTALLRTCAQVCNQAEGLVDGLGAKRNAFLVENLGDAVQQLDLILRVIAAENSDGQAKDDRRGLLKRFFTRGAEITHEEHFDAPTFDVSRQGLQGNSWSVPPARTPQFLGL